MKGNHKAVFADLHGLEEDKRISIICSAVASGKVVGFVVDSEAGKADRYISKITAQLPGIIVEKLKLSPVKGTVAVKVRLPVEHN